MHSSKKILSFALLMLASFSNIQGIALEDILKMQPVELEEYLEEKPNGEIQELKNLITLERTSECQRIEKYKENLKVGQYRIKCAQVVSGLTVIAMISSLAYVFQDVRNLTPKGIGSVPFNIAQKFLNHAFIEVLLNYPSGIALLSTYGVSAISSIYTLVNAYSVGKNQTKRIGSLERLIALIKLEEVINKVLAERA